MWFRIISDFRPEKKGKILVLTLSGSIPIKRLAGKLAADYKIAG